MKQWYVLTVLVCSWKEDSTVTSAHLMCIVTTLELWTTEFTFNNIQLLYCIVWWEHYWQIKFAVSWFCKSGGNPLALGLLKRKQDTLFPAQSHPQALFKLLYDRNKIDGLHITGTSHERLKSPVAWTFVQQLGLTAKKSWKLCVAGLRGGIAPVTSGFLPEGTSNVKSVFSFLHIYGACSWFFPSLKTRIS